MLSPSVNHTVHPNLPAPTISGKFTVVFIVDLIFVLCGYNVSLCAFTVFSLCPLAGYLQSRQAVANFFSCPEAPLEAEVLTSYTHEKNLYFWSIFSSSFTYLVFMFITT